MLYLGIDQHARQITISLRNDDGDVLLARQVDIASTSDQETRRLTTLRKDAGRARTRVINQIKHLLRRHNLQWEMPTRKFPTLRAIAWLKQLAFPQIDQ